MLANHIWSFAGDDARQDIRNTFVQPFVAYTWPSAWTVLVQSESSYKWKSEQWSAPINLALPKLVKIGGKLPVSLQAGVGYWAVAPEFGPKDLHFRPHVNIVLPKYPAFDPSQRAFYYDVRVLDIPAPRWTPYDAVHFGIERPEGVPATQQQRCLYLTDLVCALILQVP
jgi:hypothetical protein